MKSRAGRLLARATSPAPAPHRANQELLTINYPGDFSRMRDGPAVDDAVVVKSAIRAAYRDEELVFIGQRCATSGQKFAPFVPRYYPCSQVRPGTKVKKTRVTPTQLSPSQLTICFCELARSSLTILPSDKPPEKFA